MEGLNLSELPFTPGYLLMVKERMDDNFTITDNNCWEWNGGRTSFGYGKISLKQKSFNKSMTAHRVYWELINGPIPKGLVINHKCSNPPCINPDHLETMTGKENTLIGKGITAINAKKTHCINGHKFITENTGINTDGSRYCRNCSRFRTNRRGAQRTKEYHSKGLNSKGRPLPNNWKKKYGLT